MKAARQTARKTEFDDIGSHKVIRGAEDEETFSELINEGCPFGLKEQKSEGMMSSDQEKTGYCKKRRDKKGQLQRLASKSGLTKRASKISNAHGFGKEAKSQGGEGSLNSSASEGERPLAKGAKNNGKFRDSRGKAKREQSVKNTDDKEKRQLTRRDGMVTLPALDNTTSKLNDLPKQSHGKDTAVAISKTPTKKRLAQSNSFPSLPVNATRKRRDAVDDFINKEDRKQRTEMRVMFKKF